MNIFNWSLRKVGGIWFWRLGRFGGSLYVTRTVPRTFQWEGERPAREDGTNEGPRTMVVCRER